MFSWWERWPRSLDTGTVYQWAQEPQVLYSVQRFDHLKRNTVTFSRVISIKKKFEELFNNFSQVIVKRSCGPWSATSLWRRWASLAISPEPVSQRVITKRCRLSLVTNSALVYESQCGGWREVAVSQPMSTAVHITWHGAQRNFINLPPYLTDAVSSPIEKQGEAVRQRISTKLCQYFVFK